MVNSKKLLSLFLAVVMVFSVLSVMASAYTVGPEVAGDMNFKYTVEKVDMVPETDDSVEYSADNLYAVSIWMQSNSAVSAFTAPVHYNKDLFAPVMICDEDGAYPGVDQDTNYTDCADPAFYVYEEGDYLNNTGMYKADGSTVTNKRNAACIGLGNSNSEGVTIIAELVSPDHPYYDKWSVGLTENTGIVYVNLDVTGVSKTAYLNTIEGITTSTEWNKMFTFYFEALADDVTGAEFGVYTDNCFTVDGITDEYAAYYTGNTAIKGNPNKNVVSNAFVEAAAKNIVYPVKNQIQWANKDEGLVNLGVVAGFDIADIPIDFYNGEDGGKAGKSKNVESVGAIVTLGDSAPATKFEQYVYSAKEGTAYYFRAVIANIPADYDGDIVVTPLVKMYGEETPIYGEAITISAEKFATYVDKIS